MEVTVVVAFVHVDQPQIDPTLHECDVRISGTTPSPTDREVFVFFKTKTTIHDCTTCLAFVKRATEIPEQSIELLFPFAFNSQDFVNSYKGHLPEENKRRRVPLQTPQNSFIEHG